MTHERRRGFMAVAGRRVHYRACGDGPPVVLLHGSPGDSEMLVAEVAALAEAGRTAIALDTPGFGFSDALPGEVLTVPELAAATAAAMAALGLPACPVFGTHTGAAIALELGVGFPERVSGLVVDGLPVFTQPEIDELFQGYFEPLVVDPLGGHLFATWMRFRDQFTWFPWRSRDVRRRNAVDRPTPAEIDPWVTMFYRSAKTYRPAYRAACFYGPAAAPAVAALRRPAVFMASAEDMLFPHLDRLPPLQPDQRIEPLPHDFAAKLAAIVAAVGSLPMADVPAGSGAAASATRDAARPPSPGAVASASSVAAVAAACSADAVASESADAAAAASPSPGSDNTSTSAGADPRLQFVDTADGQVLLRSFGDSGRPALLLLHDAPGSGALHLDLARTLAGDFHVLLPDLPGCGESSPPRRADAVIDGAADAALAVLGHAGVDDCAVAGIGCGAAVAAALATRRGTAIRRVLLVDPVDPDAATAAAIAPPLPLSPDGGHWLQAWMRIRDGQVADPWFDGRIAAQRSTQGCFDAEWLHDQTCALMAGRESFHHLPQAAWRFDTGAAAARAVVPLTVHRGAGHVAALLSLLPTGARA